jgi:DNA-binding transcriptional regulator YdaS (Cro superfamily)
MFDFPVRMFDMSQETQTPPVAETPFRRAIRLSGGVNAAARLLGVAPSTMCYREEKGVFPIQDALTLELATGVPVEELSPSPLWDTWKAKRGLRKKKDR